MKDARRARAETDSEGMERRSSSSRGSRDFPNDAVAGFIEADRSTVSGGLLASCCGIRSGGRCVFRTGIEHVIAIVRREHCKWCKKASRAPERESDFDEARTVAYLRGVFELTVSDAGKLSELISELTRTRTGGDLCGFPFAGTPPYCTVENVMHISGPALQKVIDFDDEFVWGDNLIFNTKAERSE